MGKATTRSMGRWMGLVLATSAMLCASHGAWAERTNPPPTPPVERPHLPAPSRCALRTGDVFHGTYTCSQGQTRVTLSVLERHGRNVHASFDFNWEAGGITGLFTLRGTCDPATGRLELTPERWQRAPPGWIMVGMDGMLSADGTRYEGRMMHPSCGGFSVSRP